MLIIEGYSTGIRFFKWQGTTKKSLFSLFPPCFEFRCVRHDRSDSADKVGFVSYNLRSQEEADPHAEFFFEFNILVMRLFTRFSIKFSFSRVKLSLYFDFDRGRLVHGKVPLPLLVVKPNKFSSIWIWSGGNHYFPSYSSNQI